MLLSLLALAAVLLLIIVYVVLQSSKKTRDKGNEKLINRSVPPYETDTAKAGAADTE
ncbi:hypothetical protein [Chitinophaga alhagiae]|uniref:hypothetical protein n=1 Tax=Chitinophaga alhagiae TaxID=2203219 RepID=UPI0013003A1E|nr:hypothetical protein [Chitinophaga alhagiae]